MPLLAVFLLGAAQAATEPTLNCDELTVQYSAPTLVPLEGRVVIKAASKKPGRVLEEKNPEFIPESPQGTLAFNRIAIADTMKPGPYSNTIEVFSTAGESISWRIEINDLMDNVRLRWINDDLLYVQAWWGRIVSTDMLLEVSSGRLVYAKEANYGLLVQSCREPNPSIKGTGLRPAPCVER